MVVIPAEFAPVGTPAVISAPDGAGTWTISRSLQTVTVHANADDNSLFGTEQLQFGVQATAPTSATGSPFAWTGSAFGKKECNSTFPDPTGGQPAVSVSEPVSITVNTSPPGRSFTVDGATHNSEHAFIWVSGSNHTIETTSPQSGAAGTRYVWSNWSDGGTISHTVAPTSATTYTANFTTQYEVKFLQSGISTDTGANTVVTVSGGAKARGDLPYSVWVDDGGSVPAYTYAATVSTDPVSGKQYVLTTPAPAPASGATVSAAVTITGTYKAQYQITFAQSGIGGDTGSNTIVTVNGVPKNAGQLSFTDWYDAGATIDYAYTSPVAGAAGKQYVLTTPAPSPATGFTVSSSLTVTGTYKTQYYLTITMNPVAVGLPRSSVDPANGWYDAGATPTLTATTPVAAGGGIGFIFSNWSGDVSSSTSSLGITMNGPKSIVANYNTLALVWTVDSNFSAQYSDPTLLKVQLTLDGSPVNGKTIDFAVGTETGAAATDALGIATDTTLLAQPSGSYTAAAGCSFSQCGVILAITHSFTITKEDAMVTDLTPPSVKVVTPGGNADSFDVFVKLREKTPDLPAGSAAPGDITKAGLKVTLSPVGPGSGANKTCSQTGSTGSGYSQEVTFKCSVDPGLAVNTYSVQVDVMGDYYQGSYEGVLTIYDPSLGFTTGGGWFYWPPTEAEALNGYLRDKTNFGFNMKYNKKGTNPQGSVLMIRHLPDGRIIRMKSNAVDALSLADLPDVPMGWATIAGKGSFVDPLEGMIQPEGNHTFILYVEDRDEPGTGTDRVWVQVKDKDGNVRTDLSRELPTTIPNAVTIDGGNIVVPHTNSSGGGDRRN